MKKSKEEKEKSIQSMIDDTNKIIKSLLEDPKSKIIWK